jgi:hypothetical protein
VDGRGLQAVLLLPVRRQNCSRSPITSPSGALRGTLAGKGKLRAIGAAASRDGGPVIAAYPPRSAPIKSGAGLGRARSGLGPQLTTG